MESLCGGTLEVGECVLDVSVSDEALADRVPDAISKALAINGSLCAINQRPQRSGDPKALSLFNLMGG